jgi:hypothetical protein
LKKSIDKGDLDKLTEELSYLFQHNLYEIEKFIDYRNRKIGELQCVGLYRGIKFVKSLNKYIITGIFPRDEIV